MAQTETAMLQTRKPQPAAAQTIRVTLPARHSGQRRLWEATQAARVAIIPCGRGFGKSEEDVREIGDSALAGLRCNYGAPDYRRVEEVYDRLYRALLPVIRRNAYARRIELITGGSIEFWTLKDKTAGQSRHPDHWAIDEAGLVPYLRTIVEESIMPSMTSRKGRITIKGTPKGQNDFYYLWNRAETEPGWARFQASSYDNPLIDPAELDRLRAVMTEERFRQEIMAEFMPDGAGVFRHVRRAIYGPMATIAELHDLGHEYQVSVDCGKMKDFTVFTVIDLSVSPKRVVYVDRIQGDYIPQVQRLVALCEALGMTSAIIETNGNEAFMELVGQSGISVVRFTTSNASKQTAVDQFALALEHETVQLPDYPPLIDELMAFEGERLPSGLMRYEAPDGQHDDCVMSLIIGWQGTLNPYDYSGGAIWTRL
jgi:hypothetical protein